MQNSTLQRKVRGIIQGKVMTLVWLVFGFESQLASQAFLWCFFNHTLVSTTIHHIIFVLILLLMPSRLFACWHCIVLCAYTYHGKWDMCKIWWWCLSKPNYKQQSKKFLWKIKEFSNGLSYSTCLKRQRKKGKCHNPSSIPSHSENVEFKDWRVNPCLFAFSRDGIWQTITKSL